MANLLFPKYKESLLSSLTSATVKAVLLSSSYTYSSAHDNYDDVSTYALGTPQTIGSKTITSGTFDGADVSFTAVAGGSTATYIAVFIDTGTPSTSTLIGLIDTASGTLPVSTNGGDINTQWNASGIFSL